MSETVRWDKIKHKIWLKQKWERAKEKGRAIGRWCAEHPLEAITIVGSIAGVTKKASNAYCAHREDVRRRRDFWDPRTGRHSYVRRDLKAWEEEEVDERYNNGESYVKIFRDMNLLK